jgi:NADH-quinone oxidoreductase subunit M
LGVFEVSTPVGVVFIVGLLLGLAYLLRLLLNVGWGAPSKAAGWSDMSFREWVYLVPLGVLVIYLGVAPGKALSFLGPSIDNLLDNFQTQKELRIETASTPPAPLRTEDGAYHAWSLAGEDTRPIDQHMYAASLHLPFFQDAEPDVRHVAWLPEMTSSMPAPVRMSAE